MIFGAKVLTCGQSLSSSHPWETGFPPSHCSCSDLYLYLYLYLYVYLYLYFYSHSRCSDLKVDIFLLCIILGSSQRTPDVSTGNWVIQSTSQEAEQSQ